MIFSASALLSVLSAATADLGTPLLTDYIDIRANGCPLAGAKLSVPAGQTSLTVPSGTPTYIALGVGIQVRLVYLIVPESCADAVSRTTPAVRQAHLPPSELSPSSSTSRAQ